MCSLFLKHEIISKHFHYTCQSSNMADSNKDPAEHLQKHRGAYTETVNLQRKSVVVPNSIV